MRRYNDEEPGSRADLVTRLLAVLLAILERVIRSSEWL